MNAEGNSKVYGILLSSIVSINVLTFEEHDSATHMLKLGCPDKLSITISLPISYIYYLINTIKS